MSLEAAPRPPFTWAELLALSKDEAQDWELAGRLLDVWSRSSGASSAGLYLVKGGFFERQVAVGETRLPEIFEVGRVPAGTDTLELFGGCLVFVPADADGAPPPSTDDPLTLLLSSSLRNFRLRQELKEQQFQVNYRVVELEALYDVGLAVAATLDLERLSEEILLRAVSLLDARRGALYVLEGDSFRLEGTFGGEAAAAISVRDAELNAFLTGDEPPPAGLLPEARYFLGVPITIDHSSRGFLVMGDKESRRGVGPFPLPDRRTLGLFANQAAIALENARLHLQALEKERLEREMHLAAEIQRQILPKGAPDVPGFSLAGWNRPAREVGGDYYDLFPLASGRIGLVLGDVSGKGIPAALMVSTLHSALRLLLDRSEVGPELLEKLNRHIIESSTANKFITMLIAQLDPATGQLDYLNAGHNPGLLLRRDGRVEELGSSGVPLGLLPFARFERRSIRIDPGDFLCLYSDGITECESQTDEEFGLSRLTTLLALHRDGHLQAVLDEIQRSTDVFSQGLPQHDDQTVVLLRRD
jgi:sigma-B regulation protein RsbU (phosphoserine phosphatase)